MTKVEIVIDADVIIHFAKAGYLHKLPEIFPEYATVEGMHLRCRLKKLRFG